MTATTAVHEPNGNAAIRGYQYKHGDRPLEGYTIQRGAGRGGFGEVYYAVSDSGREVALKLIHTYEQIELRGISQCMNLKSPHLVTIFDVKYGTDGRPWVIMEYVSGPSLRQLLDAAPSGLGTQKAAFFLREIAKGLTYLHDCGIVHRDLKPANIFYENGYVKIGDYGLSKIISTSQHSGQTVTVGTVHYMAPEIGVGNYDRGIDIYALGALLYEMLTGQVPFFGASTAEVLMKHLSTNVDVGAIEEPFKTVIVKAMAKNPADRYQSVQEMVEAIFGSEHVRNSVSAFTPDSLTMVAGYVAQKIPPSGSFTPSDVAPPPSWQCDRWQGVAGALDQVGDRLARKRQWMEAKWERKRQRIARKWGYASPGSGGRASADFSDPFGHAAGDPLRLWHRIVLAAISICIVGLVAAMVGGSHKAPQMGLFVLVSTVAATVAAMLSWHLVGPALQGESPWLTRLAVGGSAAAPVILISLPFLGRQEFGGTVMAIFLGFLLMNWSERMSAARPERVVFGKLVTAAILGLVLGGMCGGFPPLAIAVLIGTSLAAMIAAPWSPRLQGNAPQWQPPPMSPPTPQPLHGVQPGQASPPPVPGPVVLPPAQPQANLRPVPRGARVIFLALFIGFATLSLCLGLALPVVDLHPDEMATMFGFAAGTLLFSLFCLRRSRQAFFSGYWRYLFRPVLQLACIQSILLAGSLLTIGELRLHDAPPAIFFIVFPSIILFVLTFLSGRGGSMTQAPPLPSSVRLPPAHEPITLGGIFFGLFRFVSNIAGLVVLVFSLLLALAVVTNLPGLFQSGLVDPQAAEELRKSFGTSEWPRIMRSIGAVASFVTALVATGLLLMPRRRYGPSYMFRALFGIGLLFAAVGALGRALPDWRFIEPGLTPGDTMATYLQMIHAPGAVWAGVLMIGGMFLLLWPPSRKTDSTSYYQLPAQQPQFHAEKNLG